MNLSSVKQKLESIDYDWRKPQTYLVFVPGLSLVIQKVQMASVLPFPEVFSKPLLNEVVKNKEEINAKSTKFANICRSHFRGSILQITVSVIAAKIFATPLFLALAVLATYEMTDTVLKCLKNSVLFYHDDFLPILETRSTLKILLG